MKNIDNNQNIKWLHLSDIHILNSTDFNMQLNCYKCLPYLFDPSFIVVSGDFRHLRYNRTFDAAKKFLEQILDIFHLTKNDIFLVPGNHDATDQSTPGREEHQLNRIISNAENVPDIPLEDIKYLKEAFLDYKIFIQDFYGNEIDKNDSRISDPLGVFYIPYNNINILLLNTALASCNDRFGENKEIK